jgi:DNA-binding transcriptional ArsR family regulator
VRPSATNPKVLRAYAHPLRARAMELLEARVTSPSQIAAALGQPVGLIAYHVRTLREAGLVTLVDRRQRRGAIEHFYTAPTGPTISDREWSRLPVVERRTVIAGGLRRSGHELGAASHHGGLDREGAHVRRVRTRLDDHGWRTATSELRLSLARLERLAAAAKRRLADLEPDRVRYGVAMLMLFGDPRHGAGDDDASAGTPIDFADPRMLTADAHPLRSEIFRLLREREASPSDVARRLGAPVSNASYHVRQLARLGLIQPTVSRESRGAIEHYYRASMRPTILGDGWHESIGDRSASATAAAILSAAQRGGFDRDDIHFTRTPFPVDREVWDRVIEVLAGARARIDTPAATTEAEPVQLVTMLFERTLGELAGARR